MADRVNVRNQIVTLHEEGLSNRRIANRLNIGVATVCRWVDRYRNNEFDAGRDRNRAGRPRALTAVDRRRLIRSSRANPFLTARQVRADTELRVSIPTVRRVLRSENLNGRLACKKEKLSAANRRGRFEFAREHLDWTEEQWGRVVFTDEKSFVIGHNGQVMYLQFVISYCSLIF